MFIRSLIQCLLIVVCTCGLSGQNLITNPSFEENNSSGTFAYWHPRNSTSTGIETANPYSGTQSAKFVNNSGTSISSYYYSNYDINGTVQNLPATEEDTDYECSIKYRTDTNFSGDGISIEIHFYNGTTWLGVYKSSKFISSTWTTLALKCKAIAGATNVIAAFCYDGQGTAWLDDASLIKKDALCKNGGFEFNYFAVTRPDFYMPRSSTLLYHLLETSFLNTYLGNRAALFNNTGTTATACYYYGPYNPVGTTSRLISVCPGDSYTLSGFGRTDGNFSGSGIFVSLQYLNNSTFVSRVDSSYIKPTVWTKMTLQNKIIPAGVNYMEYSVEYNGKNKAWFDEIRLEPSNLVKNSSFETDSATPSDKPDYWYPRSSALSYHHVDTTAYEGSKSAMFNNTSASSVACYYYGPSNTASDTIQYMDVIPGETYTFSAYGKVDTAFSGNGLMVSIAFLNDNTYVSRADSPWTAPASWTQMSVQATVPTGVNKICYSIEYNGKNKAWFDRVTLSKTDPWYYCNASSDSLEALSFTIPTKRSFAAMSWEFMRNHNFFETHYMEAGNPVGTWGVGYGTQSGNHPLVRSSANAALAYLHAYSKFTDQTLLATFENRAKAALDWLLTQQNLDTSSAQYGAFPWWWSTTPIYTGMYEGGLAGLALIKGYEYFLTKDTVAASNYLAASNRLCEYFLTLEADPNANYNSFAVMALTANYNITGNENYLNKAIYFTDRILKFQLDSGMWSDDHNQYVYYHAIITRGLVLLVNALPDSNPKKAVIKNAMFKALNHLRQRQNHAITPQSGAVIPHPFRAPEDYFCACTMTALSEAYGLLGISSLSDSLDTISVGSIRQEVVEGHSFAGVGILLDYYY